MIINGVELEFRLYDEDKADVKKKYFEALDKMRSVEKDMPEGTEKEKNQYLCGRIKTFFDEVFGAGTGVAVCGSGNDLLTHVEAYDQLVSEQANQQKRFDDVMGRLRALQRTAKK